MSVFEEKSEKAIRKALERPEIKEAVSEMMIDIIPTIAAVISAALEELKKDSEIERDDVNGE